MTNLYDPNFVAKYFDDFGEREWTRLVKTPADEIKLHVHSHYLGQYIEKGDLSLDIGAGAGRFTQILVNLGATVVVADISHRQLELNKRFANELGFAHAVKDWLQLDICDMSALPDQTFDAVVCYGSPLGYVFEKRDAALREILRVLKPGGKAFLSVGSLWGTVHELLPAVLGVSPEKNAEIISTGDLYFDASEGLRHRCHLFRASEFREFLDAHLVSILTLSASNCLSTVWGEKLKSIRVESVRWEELLRMELDACREPGCLDMGTHLIAVIEKLPH
jgi:ubiquinone/menaquinone biosynthesis C-methylase UbiE